MRKVFVTALMLALVSSAFAIVVLRDPVVEVTATTTATATDLAGTQTEWNFGTVHNHGTVRVAITIISGNNDGAAMTNYATGDIVIPAEGAVEIWNEPMQQIKHATESGTADLVIERGKQVL